jgi:hypothetical protein
MRLGSCSERETRVCSWQEVTKDVDQVEVVGSESGPLTGTVADRHRSTLAIVACSVALAAHVHHSRAL